MKLPEEDPAAFLKFTQWLYAGNIYTKGMPPCEAEIWHLLAKMYILGEKVIASVFQDRVLDAIAATFNDKCINPTWGRQRLSRYYPHPDKVNVIYDGTPQDSPLRRLMLDKHAIMDETKWIHHNPDAINHEFLVDLNKVLLKKPSMVTNGQAKQEISPGLLCVYHKHGKDRTCGEA